MIRGLESVACQEVEGEKVFESCVFLRCSEGEKNWKSVVFPEGPHAPCPLLFSLRFLFLSCSQESRLTSEETSISHTEI